MERIDDLLVNGLKLIQDDAEFCFGCDAVELANFVSGNSKDYAVDLGCGSGIIAVLLAGKKGIRTTAVEISETLSALALRNAALNGLSDMIDVINLPLQRLPEVLKKGSRSIVVCNPPYFKADSGFLKKGGASVARHEIAVTLREITECAAYLLPTGGRFYVVYTTGRMAELLHLCVQSRLQPKELVLLNAKNKDPHLCLLKCIKDAKTGLTVKARPIKDYGME